MSKKRKAKPQTPAARERARLKHLERMKPGVPISIRLKQTLTTSSLMSIAAFQNLFEHIATEDDFGEVQTFCRYHALLCGLFVIERHCPQDQLQAISEVSILADMAVKRVEERYGRTGKLGVSFEDREAFQALLDLAPEMERAATRRQTDAILSHILYGTPLPHTKNTAVGVVITRPAHGEQA